jgi:hypothetical protein
MQANLTEVHHKVVYSIDLLIDDPWIAVGLQTPITCAVCLLRRFLLSITISLSFSLVGVHREVPRPSGEEQEAQQGCHLLQNLEMESRDNADSRLQQ